MRALPLGGLGDRSEEFFRPPVHKSVKFGSFAQSAPKSEAQVIDFAALPRWRRPNSCRIEIPGFAGVVKSPRRATQNRR